jgi:hypothetical protein
MSRATCDLVERAHRSPPKVVEATPKVLEASTNDDQTSHNLDNFVIGVRTVGAVMLVPLAVVADIALAPIELVVCVDLP